MADHRWPSPNHNYVPEFQLSGIPYAITANIANNATTSFTFNSVTRWISISSDVDVQLGFNDDETIHGNYYFICKAGMTQRFELKCKKIVIKKSVLVLILIQVPMVYSLQITLPYHRPKIILKIYY